MGSIKYGLLLWKKNLTFSILVMLLVFVAVVVLNIAFVFVSNADKTYSVCKDLLNVDGGYFMGSVDWDNMEYTPEEVILQRYNEELDLLRVARTYSTLNGEQIELQAADSQLLKLLSFPIRGEMPKLSQKEGTIYVITNGGKIGDEYQVNLGLYGEKKITLRVVGTMGSPFPYFDMAGGNSITDVILWGNDLSEKKFICLLDAFLPAINDGFNYKFASFVKFKKGLSETRKNEIIFDLKILGTYFSMGTLQAAASQKASEIMSAFLPLGITITLVAAINFLMCIVLTNSKNKRLLAILYASGAKRSSLLLAVLFNGLIMSFIPSLMAMIFFVIINPFVLLNGGAASWNIPLLITGVISLLFVFLSILGFVLTVKQYKISSILKGAT